MLAKISYSVDTDEIPEEIKNIIQNISLKLQKNLREIVDDVSNGSYSRARSDLLKTRKALGDIEIKLQDIDSIISQYITLLNQQEEIVISESQDV